MSKKIDFASVIAQRVADQKPGFKGWFYRLPVEAQASLAKVRDDYRSGKLVAQKKAIARAIMDVAAEQGWKTSGIAGVIAWLDEKRPT